MAALDKRDLWLGCAGEGLELLQEHRVPSSGAVKRAGQHKQRDG